MLTPDNKIRVYTAQRYTHRSHLEQLSFVIIPTTAIVRDRRKRAKRCRRSISLTFAHRSLKQLSVNVFKKFNLRAASFRRFSRFSRQHRENGFAFFSSM